MSAKEYFITGCARAVLLADAGQRERMCEMGALTSESYARAKKTCRACPKATINEFVEAAVGEEEQIVPENVVEEEEELATLEDLLGPVAAETPKATVKAPPESKEAEEPKEAEAPWPKVKSPLPDDLDFSTFAEWGTGVQPQREAPAKGKPSVDELLAPLGVRGGPSIMGWSKISTAHKCLRLFYYKYVMGYHAPINVIRESPRYGPSVHPLPLGAALHAIHELYCLSFFDSTVADRVIHAVKPHYPLLASELARLWRRYWRAFHEEDMRHWDVRLVEAESRLYFPAKTIAGKKRSLCISSRHDTVVRKTKDGRRLPPGEMSEVPLHLHDLKTTGQMSSAAKETWAHEGQALQGMATWNHGHGVSATIDGVAMLTSQLLHEIYGKAWGFSVTQVGKAKTGAEEDLTRRLTYPVGEELVREFIDNVQDFLYEDIAPRLFHKQCEQETTWRKSYACRDPITNRVCPFATVCESNGRADPESLFEQNEKMRLKGSDLEFPKTKKRRKKKVKAEGADK